MEDIVVVGEALVGPRQWILSANSGVGTAQYAYVGENPVESPLSNIW